MGPVKRQIDPHERAHEPHPQPPLALYSDRIEAVERTQPTLGHKDRLHAEPTLRRFAVLLGALVALIASAAAFASAARAADRVFWANGGNDTISFTNLDGTGGGGQLSTTGATLNNPLGVAIDPAAGRIYWAKPGQQHDLLRQPRWHGRWPAADRRRDDQPPLRRGDRP